MLRAFVLWFLLLAAPLVAQDQQAVLLVDLDRAFTASQFGKRVEAELTVARDALIEENRRIAAELEAEEQDLTRRRPTMEPDAFRAEAEAFDERVQKIRQEQDAKGLSIVQAQSRGRDRFLAAAGPALRDIMAQRGASVILSASAQSVLVAAEGVDITDIAILAIDQAIGDGTPR